VNGLFFVTSVPLNESLPATIKRFDSSCKAIGGDATVSIGTNPIGAPIAIASGPSGVAMAFRQEKGEEGDYLKLRLTGPRLCD
jgi:hypothetical protein